MANLKKGLSFEDQQLVNRLSKLKSEIREMKGDIPSQSEIEERLAKLKGIDPEVYRKPAAIYVKPKTSNVDEATDLINQIREEVAIDRQSDLPSETPAHQSEEVKLLFLYLSYLFVDFLIIIRVSRQMMLKCCCKTKPRQYRLMLSWL